RRLLFLIFVLWGVATLTFVLSFIVPSDPALALARERAHTATIQNIRKQMGFDQPIWVHDARYVGRVGQFDFGQSYVERTYVLQLILDRFPATLQLALAGVLTQILIGIPLGVFAALRSGSLVDRGLSLMLIAGLSSPAFWTGLLLLYFLGFVFPIFP